MCLTYEGATVYRCGRNRINRASRKSEKYFLQKESESVLYSCLKIWGTQGKMCKLKVWPECKVSYNSVLGATLCVSHKQRM